MSRVPRPDPSEQPTQPAAHVSSRPARPAAPAVRRPGGGPVAPVAPVAGGRRKDSRWVTAMLGSVIAVCLAMAAAILLLGFWKPGYFLTTRLKIDEVQAAVQQILADDTTGYGIKDVNVVSCNGGRSPKVKQGASFTCDVRVSGAQRTVTVIIEDNDGTYGVSAPR